MNKIAYIALGGNIGQREGMLSSAVKALTNWGTIDSISSLYETEPWGMNGQPDFLNAVVSFNTNLTPIQLLRKLQEIEISLGRSGKGNFKSRTVDLDILLFGEFVIDEPELVIPHRHLLIRDFFLQPILEIFPDAIDPVSGIKLSEFEKRIPMQLRTIIRIKKEKIWQDTITSLSKDP